LENGGNMTRKTIFIGLLGLLALSLLVFPALTHADQYYPQYTGVSFTPTNKDATYHKDHWVGYLYHGDTNDEFYVHPVSFEVPDGSAHYIKSIGIRYRDNLTDGYLEVYLKRRNLYTGNYHTVATWNSGYSESSSSPQTASKGTNVGYKLIDTKKFAYWLYVEFNRDGDVNPDSGLVLYQIRIHYGT
jgi:hypothetical protein